MTAQTPERPVTWSEEELIGAWEASYGINSTEEARRKVLSALGAVHPAEVRERERVAFQDGLNAERQQRALDRTGHAFRERDRLYPPLLPASPPPLVLSTGTWVRSGRGGWQKAEESSRDVDRRGFFAAVEIVRTASDAEALAKWLREYGSDDERR